MLLVRVALRIRREGAGGRSSLIRSVLIYGVCVCVSAFVRFNKISFPTWSQEASQSTNHRRPGTRVGKHHVSNTSATPPQQASVLAGARSSRHIKKRSGDARSDVVRKGLGNGSLRCCLFFKSSLSLPYVVTFRASSRSKVVRGKQREAPSSVKRVWWK